MSKQFAAVDSAAVPWRNSTFAKGVRVKDLGQSDGQAMQLVQCDAGAIFPYHKHNNPEFVYILEGEVIQKGVRLRSGWVGIASAGTEEDDFTSDTGATFLIFYAD